MTTDNEMILRHTATIAAGYLSNNACDDIPGLLNGIAGALRSLDAPAKPDAVVSAKAAVKENHVVCMACGAKMQMLTRHLRKDHGWSPQQYREMFDLPPDHPMTAPAYSRKRSEMAKRWGLGKKRAA